MYLLSITRVKYPYNETIVLEFSDYNRLCEELKKMLDNKYITKNNIIRIEVEENE